MTAVPLTPPVGPRPQRFGHNAVIAVVIFILAELMFFSGLVSALTIVKTSTLGAWPPLGQPRLPVQSTALNTAALLASALMLHFAGRARRSGGGRAQAYLLGAVGLGAFFLIFQGAEWVALLGQGLTLTVSAHGAFFYLIVGAHGLHVVVALAFLIHAFVLLRRAALSDAVFQATQLFWYFVALLWPVLYWRVYL